MKLKLNKYVNNYSITINYLIYEKIYFFQYFLFNIKLKQ